MNASRSYSVLAALAAAFVLPSYAAPAKKAKAAAGPVYCAVTGEEIADAKQASATATYNNKTYYLCCAGCEPAFKKEPAKFSKLSDLRGEIRTTEAKLKALKAEMARVEKADASAPATAAPAAQAVGLQCAVTGEAIASVDKAAGKAEHNNKTYYFCCGGCKAKFASDPAKFASAADARTAR